MQSEQELRRKYRELVHQLESHEARSAKLEGLLKLLIGRLCLAGRGRDPRLDAELRRIGQAARSTLEATEVSAMLEPLSRAIAVLDEIGADTAQLLRPGAAVAGAAATHGSAAPAAAPAAAAPAPSAAGRSAAAAPAVPAAAAAAQPAPAGARTRAAAEPPHLGADPASQAAAPAMAPSHPPAPAAAAAQAGLGGDTATRAALRAGAAHPDPAAADPDPTPASAAAPETAQSAPDPQRAQRVQAALSLMLDRLSALPELRPAIAALHDPDFDALSAEELAERLERVTSLIGAQRITLLREKSEIEGMLRQIDSRLEAISAFFAYEDAAQASTRDSSTKLNTLVMGEVKEISADVHSAASLTELRGRVGTRLEAINSHLSEFRQREEERLSAQVDRTAGLRARVEELERESRILQENLQKEQRAATIDALTGIPNRAAYDDRMAQDYARWQRYGGTISIVAWDVDRFKAINDDFGHKAGDKVLRVIAQHLAHNVRGTDFVARYGGEEFVMILIDISPDQALKSANKIRAGIQSIAFHFHDVPVTVTASCGVTTFRMGDTPDLAFERADGALYEAKEAGRNRCVAR